MKKITLTAIICIATICTSCVKEQMNVPQGEKKNYPVFTASMEEITPAEECKADLDTAALTVSWAVNDTIFVTDGTNKALYVAASSGSSGVTFNYLKGDELATGPEVTYTAYYPHTMVQEDGSLRMSLAQPYVFENIKYIPMKAEATGSLNLNFSNLTGIVRIKLTNTGTTKPQIVRHLGLAANTPLSGYFTIVNGKAVVETGKSMQGVTFDYVGNKPGGETPGENDPIKYYLAVPEGEYTNFAISVSCASHAASLIGKKPIKVYRSKVTQISYRGKFLGDDNNYCKTESLQAGNWNQWDNSSSAANCFVVSKRGTKTPYIMPKNGKKNEAITGCAEAEVLWETACETEEAIERGSIIRAVQCYHTTKGELKLFMEFPNPLKAGNALIALRDNAGDIIYSYHIWVTPNDEPADIAYTKADGTAIISMLDRNIGALGVSKAAGKKAVGFFYQPDRKDPFNPSYTYAGVKQTVISTSPVARAYADANPMVYLNAGNDTYWRSGMSAVSWSSGASYDPCPYGYSVPAITSTGLPWKTSPYFGTDNLIGSGWDECGWNVQVNSDGAESWFPTTGYLTKDMVLQASSTQCCLSAATTKLFKYTYNSSTGATTGKPDNTASKVTANPIRCIKKQTR